MNETLGPLLARVQRPALGVGVVALLVSAIGFYVNATQFMRSYLTAFWFWLAVTLGCLAVLMVQYFVKGKWGFLIRRILEAGSRTILLMVALFVPIVLMLPRLYVWARPEQLASLDLPPFKREYLTTPFWMVRAAVYFIIWCLWIYLLNKWSAQEDEGGHPELLPRMRAMSGPGLLLFGFTVSYAAIDWVMSLEPGFFSTIYGLIFMVIPALLGVSVSVIVLRLLSGYEPFVGIIEPKRFNDYGNLMLVFTMLWAYLQFDQFLIIWAGNLQDEIPWYVIRAKGTWGGVALALFAFHFAFPFLLLLQRAVTRRAQMLSVVAIILLVMEWIDLYWIIQPAFSPHAPNLSWMDLTLFVGIGGAWVSVFVGQLKKRSLVPLHDPRFEGEAFVGA